MQHRFAHAVWFVLAALIFIYCPHQVRGQDSPETVSVVAGVTFFNDPELDTVVLVEFPFTLNRNEFEFFYPDTLVSKLYARIYARVMLYGIDGLPLDSASTYFSVAAATPDEATTKGIKLFNHLSLLVAPGVYSARLSVVDVVSKKAGEFFLDQIVVQLPGKERLTIGGVCLAYDISLAGAQDSVGNSRTLKNNFNVLTNPQGIYGITHGLIHLYAELYNLKFDPAEPSNFKLGYRVLASNGEVYQNYGYRLREKPGGSVVITESFDIAGWPSGDYELQIEAEDFGSGQVDTHSVPFMIVAPRVVAVARALPQDTAGGYDTLSLKIKLNLVFYMLDPVEQKTIASLRDVGKENFLKQYWREHDSYPGTPEIENRRQLLERYIYCNRKFSSNEDHTNGWLSDRGRIFMVFGLWEEREDIQIPQIGNPFLIWKYHSYREGAVFVFEDRHGYEDYILVHSNVDGEIYNAEWEAILRDEFYKAYNLE